VDAVAGDNSTVTDEDSSSGKCPMPLWIFCFEDLSTNPLFGPSTDTLLKMGAKTGQLIVEGNEWERLLKCIYLHGGLVHLAFNMSGLIQLGLPIERSYGTAKVMIIYFSAGIFGSIMSTIFDPNSVGVGASGAIFGLFGAAWGDLIQNWDLYESPGWTLLSLLFGTVMNLGLGTTPILDNFAHFFGFVMGTLVSLGLLVVERQTADGRHLKLSYWHYFLEFFPVVLVPFLFVASFGVLFAGVSGVTFCPWCPHINCVPFPWGCDVQGSSCIFDCNTCASSGVTADASIYDEDFTNATVIVHCPVLTDWTSKDSIDYVLKHQDVTNADATWLIKKCKEVCPDAFY
jgi:membrane associated rhomboid family serine protease